MKTKYLILITFIAIIVAGIFLGWDLRAEFFDIFGLLVFVFLIILGSWIIYKKKISFWIGFILVLIGVLGLVVDGNIVVKTFLMGG